GRLRAGLAAGDAAALREAAHTFKGAVGNLSAGAAFDAVRRLEAAAAPPGRPQDAAAALDALEAELDRLPPALRRPVARAPRGRAAGRAAGRRRRPGRPGSRAGPAAAGAAAAVGRAARRRLGTRPALCHRGLAMTPNRAWGRGRAMKVLIAEDETVSRLLLEN